MSNITIEEEALREEALEKAETETTLETSSDADDDVPPAPEMTGDDKSTAEISSDTDDNVPPAPEMTGDDKPTAKTKVKIRTIKKLPKQPDDKTKSDKPPKLTFAQQLAKRMEKRHAEAPRERIVDSEGFKEKMEELNEKKEDRAAHAEKQKKETAQKQHTQRISSVKNVPASLASDSNVAALIRLYELTLPKEALETDLNTLKYKIDKLKKDIVRAKKKIARLQRKKSKSPTHGDVLQKEITALQNNIPVLQKKIAPLQKKVPPLQKKIDEHGRKIDTFLQADTNTLRESQRRERDNGLQKARDRITNHLNKLKAGAATIAKRRAALKQLQPRHKRGKSTLGG